MLPIGESSGTTMKRDTSATRRRFLQATGALGIGSTIALAGCVGSGGGNGSGTNNGSNSGSSGGDASFRKKNGLPEVGYNLGDTLNVFQWTDYWPTDTIKNFEKAYGVTVNISNFASNEEMFNKLKAGGTGQFDAIFPTQNMLRILSSQELIQPLDLKKISTWDNLSKKWKKNQSYDPGNERYSVPYQWGTSGIGWHTDMVSDASNPPSWDLMWNEQYKGQMTMLNSPRETIGASLMRLGYSLNAKDQAKIDEAKSELIKQKSFLKTYSSVNRNAALANRNASPVHLWNGDALRAIRQLEENGQSPAPIKYSVPKEGGLKWLDTMAITKNAAHTNAAHAFATYLLNAKVGANIAEYNGYTTPNEAAKQHISDEAQQLRQRVSVSSSTAKELEFVNRFSGSPDVAQYYSRAWTEIQNA